MLNSDRMWPARLSETEHTPQSLLDALGRVDEFPEAEVLVAIVYASEIEPHIVALIETARRGQLNDHGEMALFRGIHILGAQKLTSAYRPLIALLRKQDSKSVHRLLGDGVTETLGKILAGMFDGDAEPLLSLISDELADEYVRNSAMRALVSLTFDGKIDRHLTETFLDQFEFTDRSLPGCYVWHSWMTAVGVLGIERMRSRVAAAFKDDRIPPDVADEDDFNEIIGAALESPSDPRRLEREHLGYIQDALVELRRFRVSYDEEDDDLYLDEFESFEPYRNPFKDVGRNDPCPCGSGRKFKKCCGG